MALWEAQESTYACSRPPSSLNLTLKTGPVAILDSSFFSFHHGPLMASGPWCSCTGDTAGTYATVSQCFVAPVPTYLKRVAAIKVRISIGLCITKDWALELKYLDFASVLSLILFFFIMNDTFKYQHNKVREQLNLWGCPGISEYLNICFAPLLL